MWAEHVLSVLGGLGRPCIRAFGGGEVVGAPRLVDMARELQLRARLRHLPVQVVLRLPHNERAPAQASLAMSSAEGAVVCPNSTRELNPKLS